MITEGYIKELRISKGEVKLTIEPTSPFAIEHNGKRYMLLCNSESGKDGTCSLKDGVCSLCDIGLAFSIDLWEPCKESAPNLMATFKASHAKCRFTVEIGSDDKKTITEVTAL